MSIKDFVTEEELFHMALQLVNFDTALDSEKPGELIVAYIINEWGKQGKDDFTDEELQLEYNDRVLGYTLSSLSNKGLIDIYIDEDGEETIKKK
jgi:hypothetical protein